MTFAETALEAAKRGLSIHIRSYGEGVAVYVVTASGHEFAKCASDPRGVEKLLANIPDVFDKAAAAEAKGAAETLPRYFCHIVDARKHGHGPFWTPQADGTYSHPAIQHGEAMSDVVKLRFQSTDKAAMQAMMQPQTLVTVDRGCAPDPSRAEGPFDVDMHLAPMPWPRPIPVSERLPEAGENTLFHHGDWTEGVYPWDLDFRVTHWLPLPPAPEAT